MFTYAHLSLIYPEIKIVIMANLSFYYSKKN